MLEKTITIGDKQVKFRSSATIPRLYRAKFKRDIFKDLSRLESSYKGNSDDGSSLKSRTWRFSRTWPISWPTMLTTVFRQLLKSGWMNSRCSPPMRCFLKFSNSGA